MEKVIFHFSNDILFIAGELASYAWLRMKYTQTDCATISILEYFKGTASDSIRGLLYDEMLNWYVNTDA